MKRAFEKTTIFAVLVLFLVVVFAMPAMASSYWLQQNVRFSAIAGETLTTGTPVCIAAADSYAYKADADSSTRRPAVGIIGKGGASGTTV
jgi:hypothetical protein